VPKFEFEGANVTLAHRLERTPRALALFKDQRLHPEKYVSGGRCQWTNLKRSID
jgi:hypothetical protein